MTKKIDAAYYATLIKGLRRVATGFDAADGYDLRNVDKLNRGQRAKITRYANEIRQLTARENYQFHPRDKEHLRIAQKDSGHRAGFPAIKVAFVPFVPPLGSKITRPKLVFKGESMITKTPNWDKYVIPFNKKKIITETDLEIARALAKAPPKAMIQIQTGAFNMGNAYNAANIAHITAVIKELMAKYDGKQQKRGTFNPRAKGRKGKPTPGNKVPWNPKHHHWSQWLDGFIAYKFHPGGAGNNVSRTLQAQADARARSALRNKQRRAQLNKLRKGK